jgi:hypothetical protein
MYAAHSNERRSFDTYGTGLYGRLIGEPLLLAHVWLFYSPQIGRQVDATDNNMMMHLANEMIEDVAVIISAVRIGGEKAIEQLP